MTLKCNRYAIQIWWNAVVILYIFEPCYNIWCILVAESGIQVLEVGCSTGLTSYHMAQLFPNSIILGTDICEKEIEAAEQKAREENMSNLSKWQILWSNPRDIEGVNPPPLFLHGIWPVIVCCWHRPTFVEHWGELNCFNLFSVGVPVCHHQSWMDDTGRHAQFKSHL